MPKLDTFGAVLKQILRHPRSLKRTIDKEEKMRQYVINKYGKNNGLAVIDLLDILPNFKETVTPYSFLEGTSLPIDIVVLKALARRYDKCSYLEIGTWRGESISNIAAVADKCVSVDLSEAEMREMDFSNGFIKVRNFFSKDLENVKYIEHNSQTYDFADLKNQFDLVFVDGDHAYESVKSDTANAFKLLRNDKSIIVWHDYGISPETVNWSVIAGILDGCPEDKRDNLYHISNTLMAVYTKERFKARSLTFPQTPNKIFTVKIKADKM